MRMTINVGDSIDYESFLMELLPSLDFFMQIPKSDDNKKCTSLKKVLHFFNTKHL